MADRRYTVLDTISKRLKEMLDGSHAEVVVASGINVYQAPQPATGVTSLAVVATLLTDGLKQLNVEVQVTGAALTAFQILGRCHESGTYQLLYSTAGDYTSPAGLLIGTKRSDGSSDLTTTPAGVTAFFEMVVTGFESIQIKASAGSAATVTVLAGGQ